MSICRSCTPDTHRAQIYAHRTHSEVRRNQELPRPSPHVSSPPPSIGLQKAEPIRAQQSLPEITPGRRGRVPPTAQQQQRSAKPSPSPARGASNDPFAALDNPSQPIRAAAVDELSTRFPSLDEFSILHDKGGKFNFEPSGAPIEQAQESLNKRVTDALADQAFVQATTSNNDLPLRVPSAAGVSRSTSLRKDKAQDARVPQVSSPHAIQQPTPQRPSYTSIGTMTSSSPPPPTKLPEVSRHPIWRVPAQASGDRRVGSQPALSESAVAVAASLKPATSEQRPGLTELQRSRSQTITRSTLNLPKSPASSRPSLEGQRPAALELATFNDQLSDSLTRSKSANSRNRPSGTHVESNLDFLRDKEKQHPRRGSSRGASLDLTRAIPTAAMETDASLDPGDRQISSDMEFLRKMESEDSSKKRHHRRVSSGSKHTKRSSMPSISLSKTKHNLAGKFGDAFRRFEGNAGHSGPKSPEATEENSYLSSTRELTPIAGSEATGSTRGDDDLRIDETEDLSPEVRRELEKRILEQEERRVEAATAEYRKRMADGGRSTPGGSAKASSIQNRVRNLLDDAEARPGQKTAQGYGRFTKDQNSREESQSQKARQIDTAYGSTSIKPSATLGNAHQQPQHRTKPQIASILPSLSVPAPVPASTPPAPQRTDASIRAVAPPKPSPKPVALRTGSGVDKPLPGVPAKRSPLSPPPGAKSATASTNEVQRLDGTTEDSWEADFSKRYPSLSGLEMVERQV